MKKTFTRMKKGAMLLFLGWGMLSSLSAQCPTPSALSSAATCGQGATLTASGSTGLYRWYNQPSGGSVLGTGATFATPAMYAQATYYVEAVNSYNNPNCISPRAALVVTVNPLAMPTITGDTVTCGGTATLSAAGSTGLYRWFAGPTGGAVLGTGANFTPPSTLQSATYYVEATNNLNPNATVTFNYTGGQQSWTVPAGVFSLQVTMEGAEGSRNTNYNNRGGFGGRVVANLAVTPGQTIFVFVGGWPGNAQSSGGYNGGGNQFYSTSFGCSGGGATDLRIGGTGTNNRVMVAAGGGGGGWNCGTDGSRGGDGGGTTGEDGLYCSSTGNTSFTGRGGSPTSGGAAGGNWCCPQAGSAGQGGQGDYRGGAGGGGWFGGGGSSYGGGAGGSNYADPNLCSNIAHTRGTRQGHGTVTFNYSTPFCTSARVPVPLTVTPLATPTANPINTTCGSNITASASGSTGWYHWFAAPTGGSPLSTQSNYSMTFVNQTDTIWVEAVSDPNPSGTQTFNYTGGNQTWTVPGGVFSVAFDVRGAQGGTNTWSNGGKGGKVTGTLAVTPGQVLNIYVGQQPGSGGCCTGIWGPGGWNGGGQGYAWSAGDQARGGGGASDIRIGGTGLNNRVVVAGGGGGGGGQGCNGNNERGGDGGGSGNAQNGFYCGGNSTCYVGNGGTQTAGGQGAQCGPGQNGQAGVGGNAWGGCCGWPSGGGGGGWFGGGGAYYYGGGGGGSSYADPNLTSNLSHTQGDQTGNGQVVISFVKTYCSSTRVPVAINVAPLAAPVTQGDSVTCGTPVTLTATSNSTVSWFDAPTGGNLVAIGPSISLPPILGSDTLFAGSLLTNNLSGSQTFNFTGAPQTYTVPANVTSITVDVQGAQGGGSLPSPGSNPGGLGGRVQTTVSVTPGEVLAVYVGGTTSSNAGGYNGGGQGTSNGAGGGGGSDIRSGGTGLANRIVTAGGGGGGGWNCGSGMNGGHGGGSGAAQNGFNCGSDDYNSCVVGGGASPTAGGQQPGCGCGTAGTAGQGGQGGTCGNSGGGGGGGQFGGGGGYYAGGGGGSSFANAARTSNTTHTQGFRSGNGQIVISYNVTLVCASPRVPAVIWLDSLPAPVASGDTAFCGSGSASLTVTGPNGNYVWYDNWGGNLMNIGQNWTTPSLTQTINYHVNYTVNGCPSKFDTALVQVTPIPVALLSDPGIICAGNGVVDLGFDPPLLTDSLMFTSCGVTGRTGPDQAAADATYGLGVVTVTNGVQSWVAPFSGTYTITAAGGAGGTANGQAGGQGAIISGQFQVQAGQVIRMMVGQKAADRNGASGGGGGTFVVDATNTPMIVAGGGSGAASGAAGNNGEITTNGGEGDGCVGNGGQNGNGGGSAANCGQGAGGGGGFFTDGQSNSSWGSQRGFGFANGGLGGVSSNGGADGGFGGGAGTHTNNTGGGAGGGYSGGGAPNHGSAWSGGGGGSFNAGSNQVNQNGGNSGDGWVRVFYGIPQPSDTNGVWSGVTITDTVLGTFNPQLGVLGNNTVVYTVTNNGCTFQDSLIINVVQGPDASITTASAQLCDYDNSISLAALNSGGNWSGNGVSVVGNNISFDPGSVSAGTYQAYHSIFDAATGCLSTDSVQIVVNPTPNASVTAPSVICSADAPFSLQPGTPGGVFTGAGVTDTVTGVFTPNANLVGNTMVYYNVTANGCVNNDSAQLTIFVSPNANITNAPQQLCANSANILLQAATVGGNWYGNGMANSGSGLFDVQLAGTGTAQVIYMVSNANCTNSDTVNIVVNPMPVVNVTPNSIQNICSGSSIPMSASGAVTYQWTNGGSPISGANTANYTASANGNYSVVGTDANGCTTISAPVAVNVLPNPVVYQMTAPTVCEGSVTSFTQNSGIGQGGVITSYNWDFGDGNNGTGFSTNHTYAAPGTYQATLIVATPQGCSDTLSQLVQVNPAPVVDSVQNLNVCYPAPASFGAFVSGTNVASYNWNFGNGSTGNGQTVSHNYSSPGTYYYNLVTTGVNGCTSTFNGTVVIERTPVAGFLSSNGCTDQPLNFYDNSTGSVVSYNWNFGNGTSNVSNPTNVFTQPGTYPVTLTVSTGQGCSDSHVQNVTINQTPDATWISNNMGVNQVQFSLFSPTNGASYLWSFGDGTSSNQPTPLKNYAQAGTYYVCVSVSKNGCTSTECDSVTAKDIFSFNGPDAEAMNLNVYPNPFTENVMVGMQLTESSAVVASLRDVTGKLIATFDLGQRSMGNHQVELETAPLNLSTGTYMLTLDINGKLFTSRVVRGH